MTIDKTDLRLVPMIVLRWGPGGRRPSQRELSQKTRPERLRRRLLRELRQLRDKICDLHSKLHDFDDFKQGIPVLYERFAATGPLVHPLSDALGFEAFARMWPPDAIQALNMRF